MKRHYFIILVTLVIGFAAGASSRLLAPRYELIGGSAGNAFRFDARTGDTWLISSLGQETLVIPPQPQLPIDVAKSVYEELKNAKLVATTPEQPKTMRNWAIQMNRLTAKDGNASSGIYDAAAQKGAR